MRIKIFSAGGSIRKRYSTQESAFIVAEPAIGQILQEANVTIDYRPEPLLRKHSLNITDDDCRRILECVDAAPHRRIVATHGTETMIDTARLSRPSVERLSS